MERNLLISGVIGIVLGLVLGWGVFQAKPSTSLPEALNQTAAISQKELDLRMNMRKLWEDHITWTRMYMISAITNTEDKDNVAQRLLKNQEDLGNAIKPYYGNEAGDQLTSLLKTHITTAVDLIDAAKSNNQTALDDANTRWYNNANDIADFLSKANPNLPNDEIRSMMRDHLDLTKQEAVNIINNRSEAHIADYDKIHAQILEMSDALSLAIIKQFPDKFS